MVIPAPMMFVTALDHARTRQILCLAVMGMPVRIRTCVVVGRVSRARQQFAQHVSLAIHKMAIAEMTIIFRAAMETYALQMITV